MKKTILSAALAAVLTFTSAAAVIPAIDVSASAASELTYGDFTYTINGENVTIVNYNGSDSYVEIPDMIDGRYVTEIGENAFRNRVYDALGYRRLSDEPNDTLVRVSLPNHLKVIGQLAFKDCVALESVVFPNSLTTLHYGAFKGCSSLNEVIMGNNVSNFYDYASDKNRYPDRCFQDCTSLSRISLSETINEIGHRDNGSSFSGCTSLYEIYFRSDKINEFTSGFTSLYYWLNDNDIIKGINYHFKSQESYDSANIICTTDYYSSYYASKLFDVFEENGIGNFYVTPLSESHAKVTFNTNGGDTANTELWTLNGQMVSEEIPPTKKDCEFVGWYTNREGTGEPWDFSTDRVYSDMTLYAKWRSEQHTVKFDAQGGSCSVSKQDYSYGSAMGSLPVPTRTNYKFIGWYTRPNNGGELYTESTIMPRSDITLYAGWLQEGKSLIVTYNPNGGSCDTEKSMVGYDQTIPNLPTPTLKGSKFLEWNTSPYGDGDTYTSSTRVKVPDLTLYAIWDVQKYTLTFNANKGTVGTTSKQIAYNSAIGSLPTPKRDGYEFMGWYYNDGRKASASDIMPSENTKLTAKWRGFEYMILFDPRSGTVSSDTKFVCCGDNVGTLPTPTRKGYQFMGWYTKTGCKGTKYTSTTEMPEKDITLYAGWKKISGYATSVKLNQKSLTLGVGQKSTLNAETTPVYTLDTLKWTSSNTNVAAVSNKGVVTAKSAGTATIKVTTSKGKTASVKVTVKKAVSKISVPYATRSINIGQVVTISPTPTGYAGSSYTWTSSSPTVAKVDSEGNVTGLKKGTATITVKAYNGASATVKITVK